MTTALAPMQRLDAMGADAFSAGLAPLFEGAPRFLARIAADRPYGTYQAMLERARVIASTMPEDEQVELLASHPRIGAPPDSVSELSFREQGYDRPSSADGIDLADRLEELNREYEARFGFRFVVFVAGRSRDEIAQVIARSLEADREAEKQRALQDVVAIAADRLERLGVEEG
jgi:OHCU decarboxylase